MNSKSILTKNMLTFCISALLILQPAFGQPAKAKAPMTPVQIEAFLKEAHKNGWQVTVKTKNASFSGKVDYVWSGERVNLADKHFIMGVGPCGAQGPDYEYNNIMLADIVTVSKRIMPLYILRSTGEASLTLSASAVFLGIGLPVFAVQSAIQGLSK